MKRKTAWSARWLGVVASVAVLSSCPSPQGNIAPDVIRFTPDAGNGFSESFDYDEENNRFVVGGLAGNLGTVDREGNYTAFAQLPAFFNDPAVVPPGHIAAALSGITIDEQRDRVLAIYAIVNFQAEQPSIVEAYIVPYNQDSGELLREPVQMSTFSPFFESNGIGLDVIEINPENGDAYISDLNSPVIYRMDTDFNVSVFINDPILQDEGTPAPGPMEINDGELFIFGENKRLYSVIPGDASTLREIPITNVESLDEIPGGPDGMTFFGEDNFVMSGNVDRRVMRFTTSDDWQTAQLVKGESFELPGAGFLTEIRNVDGEAYVINSRFDEFFG